MKRINLDNAVILDTETTGLGSFDEVVEVSIIDAQNGDVLLSSLVCPIKPIPLQATEIHGITYDDVRECPTILELWPQIMSVLSGRNVLIYNSDFDTRLLRQSVRYSADCDALISAQHEFISCLQVRCVMRWYAAFWGEWNDSQQDFKWQSLVNACAQQDIDVSDLSAHRAVADCEMTRRLIHAVNSQLEA